MSNVDDTMKVLGIIDGLTEAEHQELLGLEYVLTWGYSDDLVKDDARYRALSEKKWKSREESEKDC